MNQIKEVAMPLDNALRQAELFGSGDEYIRFIEEKFNVSVVYRDGTLKISGDTQQTDKAAETIRSLMDTLQKGQPIEKHTVE